MNKSTSEIADEIVDGYIKKEQVAAVHALAWLRMKIQEALATERAAQSPAKDGHK